MYVSKIIEIDDSLGIIFAPALLQKLQLKAGDTLYAMNGPGREVTLATKPPKADASPDATSS